MCFHVAAYAPASGTQAAADDVRRWLQHTLTQAATSQPDYSLSTRARTEKLTAEAWLAAHPETAVRWGIHC